MSESNHINTHDQHMRMSRRVDQYDTNYIIMENHLREQNSCDIPRETTNQFRDQSWCYRSTAAASEIMQDFQEFESSEISAKESSRSSAEYVKAISPHTKLTSDEWSPIIKLTSEEWSSQISFTQAKRDVSSLSIHENFQEDISFVLNAKVWFLFQISVLISLELGILCFGSSYQAAIQMESLPISSRFYWIFSISGFFALISGLVRDHFNLNPIHLFRMLLVLLSLGLVFLIVSSVLKFDYFIICALGVYISLASYGCLLPQFLVLGMRSVICCNALLHTKEGQQLSFLIRFLYCSLFASIFSHFLYHYILISSSTSQHYVLGAFSSLALLITIILFFHLPKKYNEKEASFLSPSILSFISENIKTNGYFKCLSFAICLLFFSFSLLFVSNFIPSSKTRDYVMVTCVIVCLVSLLLSYIFGMYLLNPNKSNLDKKNNLVLILFPLMTPLIIANFLHTQLFSGYILQACQINIFLNKKKSIYLLPETLSAFSSIIAMTSIVIYRRFFQSKSLIERIGIGILCCLISSFMSGIIELYRRSSDFIPDMEQRQIASTCHKPVADFPITYLFPQLFLMGLGSLYIRLPSLQIFFQSVKNRNKTTAMGLWIFLESAASFLSLSIASLNDRLYATYSNDSELALLLILFTTLGCFGYASLMFFNHLVRQAEENHFQ